MQFEVVLQELARGAVMIPALVTGVTSEEARVKPSPEAWSVLEVVCHLLDEERYDFKVRLDYILHKPDQPWPPIDPPGWVTAHRYSERDLAQVLDEFLDERGRSLAWLKTMSASQPVPDWNAAVEATFGPSERVTIRAGDMLAAWAAHDVLHMRQLVELRYARLLRLAEPYNVMYAGGW